jgi:hypothetical protein
MNFKGTFWPYFAIIGIASLLGGMSSAEIDTEGYDPSVAPVFPTSSSKLDGCNVLYYSEREELSVPEISALQSLGLNVTGSSNPVEMTLEYLLGFNVLVLAFVPPGELTAQAAAIEQFVSVGGSLYIHQPAGQGDATYGPPGFEVSILSNAWCTYPGPDVWACIIDPSHPLVTSFTNDDLGGALDWVGDLGSGFSIVAESCVCHDPAIAAGEYGDGLVVFDTTYLASVASPHGDFIVHFFTYLCEGQGPVATESTTWGSVKSFFR